LFLILGEFTQMNFQWLIGNPRIPVYAQIDLKQATLTIKDGGANTLLVKIGEGNLTFTERKNIEYVLDRGNLDEVREGDQAPVEVSFDFVWEYLMSEESTGAPPTIEEALTQTGHAAAWASSDTDACRPYAVDLVIVYDPTCATGDVETITLADFRFEQLDHDLRAGTVAVSGRCNITTSTKIRGPQT